MSTQMAGRGSLHRLLVPLDGSHLAECVLPAAISLGVRLNARVILLHVMERAAPAVVHGERHLTETRQAEEYLGEIASQYGIRPVEIERHVHPNFEDDVTKSIIEHESALRTDLVVLSGDRAGVALFTPSATAASLEMEEATAEKSLRTIAAQIQASGVRVLVSVARGDPAQEILDTARRTDAGMIAMATHGRAGL